MIANYISLPVFLISFIIGIVCIYFWGPEKKDVLMFPNIYNYGKLQYKDHADQCFSFTPISVECPVSETDIKTVPIQA